MDLGSRLFAWLRPDLVPPFLFIKDPQSQSSRILVGPHLIDAEFRKAWMPFFLKVWTSSYYSGQVLGFCSSPSTQRRPILSFRGSRGASCKKSRRLKSLPLVGWMVGPGMRLKLSLFPGSPVWQFCSSWLRLMVFGLKGFWMPVLP